MRKLSKRDKKIKRGIKKFINKNKIYQMIAIYLESDKGKILIVEKDNLTDIERKEISDGQQAFFQSYVDKLIREMAMLKKIKDKDLDA